MATMHDLVAVLQRHIGAGAGMSVEQLAFALFVTPREVRKLVSRAREEGIAICAHPKTGYYIASTAEDLERTCAFLRSRAMHSLVLEARLRKTSLAELLGQIKLNT